MPLIKSITLPNALKSSSCAIMLFFVAFPNSSEERGDRNARLFNVFFV